MAKQFQDKNLTFTAKGDIKIEKFIKVEKGAVYNDGGEVTMNVYGEEQPKKPSATAADEAVVAKLIPLFKGDEAGVRRFLASISGAMPTIVTAWVNELVKEGKIAPESKKKPLWTILHDHGLYTKTLTNWNDQIQ